MTKLSVNINKVATIRNARGGNNPNVLKVAQDCEQFGAQGITVHPRPDERHIRYQDVRDLRPLITTEFNIEGNPIDSFVKLVLEVIPDTIENKAFLTDICKTFKDAGIRTSIFVDPNPKMVEGAKACGADRVELYTEPYASNYATNREAAIAPFIAAAEEARKLGLGLNAGHDLSLENLHYNAGHDLSLENLHYFHEMIPWTDEVSIGHAIICDALYMGLKETIRQYLQALK